MRKNTDKCLNLLYYYYFFIFETVNAEDIREEKKKPANFTDKSTADIYLCKTIIVYLFDICLNMFTKLINFKHVLIVVQSLISMNKIYFPFFFFFFCKLWLVYSYHICLPRVWHNCKTMNCQFEKKKKIAVQVLVYTYPHSKRPTDTSFRSTLPINKV